MMQGGETHPQPQPDITFPHFDVRNLLPIFPPPEPLGRPPLPFEQRKPSFDAPYTLSTHLIPATYIRTTWSAPIPPLPPANASKKERDDIVAKALETLIANSQKKAMVGYPRVLWNCLNRYVRKGLNGSNGTGVTLFLVSGAGFPKEVKLMNSMERRKALKFVCNIDLGTYTEIFASFDGPC